LSLIILLITANLAKNEENDLFYVD